MGLFQIPPVNYNENLKFSEEEETGRPPKKPISRLYSCLQSGRKFNTTYIKVKWEKEAQIIITDEDWFMQRCDSHIRLRPVEGVFLEKLGALFC